MHHPEHRITRALQVEARQGLTGQAREQFTAHMMGDALRQPNGEAQVEQADEPVGRTETGADLVLGSGGDVGALGQIRLEERVAGIADEQEHHGEYRQGVEGHGERIHARREIEKPGHEEGVQETFTVRRDRLLHDAVVDQDLQEPGQRQAQTVDQHHESHARREQTALRPEVAQRTSEEPDDVWAGKRRADVETIVVVLSHGLARWRPRDRGRGPSAPRVRRGCRTPPRHRPRARRSGRRCGSWTSDG